MNVDMTVDGVSTALIVFVCIHGVLIHLVDITERWFELIARII
jgi:hypothetical protein